MESKNYNIWDFINAKTVKITDMDDNVFIGNVVAIFDKEETYDEEDSIDVSINGEITGFLQSEIKSIEKIE